MENIQITVHALVDAPVSKVWDYYTNPDHITGWNFASPDWCCPRAENDLRAGGKYMARMEARDGSFGFDFEAVYDEVLANHKIVYTMADGRKAVVLFRENQDKTEVTVTFDAENQNPADLQKQGWQAILDNFRQYTETN